MKRLLFILLLSMGLIFTLGCVFTPPNVYGDSIRNNSMDSHIYSKLQMTASQFNYDDVIVLTLSFGWDDEAYVEPVSLVIEAPGFTVEEGNEFIYDDVVGNSIYLVTFENHTAVYHYSMDLTLSSIGQSFAFGNISISFYGQTEDEPLIDDLHVAYVVDELGIGFGNSQQHLLEKRLNMLYNEHLIDIETYINREYARYYQSSTTINMPLRGPERTVMEYHSDRIRAYLEFSSDERPIIARYLDVEAQERALWDEYNYFLHDWLWDEFHLLVEDFLIMMKDEGLIDEDQFALELASLPNKRVYLSYIGYPMSGVRRFGDRASEYFYTIRQNLD